MNNTKPLDIYQRIKDLDPTVQAYVLADADIQKHILERNLDAEEIDSLVYSEIHEQTHGISIDMTDAISDSFYKKVSQQGLSAKSVLQKLVTKYATGEVAV
jgi:hypothetical protein